ncbi:flavodoxin family protein [Desulfoferula mesophila]|uniref:Flavodoxin family protein n=1 Tax=Desulfoferula mesophila TaxID=3058419 RepID=A0AAU9EG17_9BACT|nr:flavodoxin family protein [Desulfoferula mesophilus]
MQPQILGVSGSPVANSNTDRLVRAVLEASGLPGEFVKLSDLEVGPCRGCLGCRSDNVCKVNDDFPALAEKVRRAGALVVGGHATYGTMNGFTKLFLERLFSLRHRRGLNRGKLAVAVATGNGRGRPGLEAAADQIAHSLAWEGMEVLGTLRVTGNPRCLVCGYGPTCPMSALPHVFGPDNTEVTPDKFRRVEDQTEVWQRAQELGREIGARLAG